MIQIVAAAAAFGLWHSLLCSDGAKNLARRALGARRGTGWYRAFFMAQAFPTTAALVLWTLTRPHRTVYRARGWARGLGWSAQAASLGIALWALRDLDAAKFAGIKGVRQLREGEIVSQAQAQGPELDEDGQIGARGAFRWSRHPLEWAPLALLLTTPTLKTNWLALDLALALYSLLGALHEEKRLQRQNPRYAAYQRKVAFFLGWPRDA